jgi:hypothetical protein
MAGCSGGGTSSGATPTSPRRVTTTTARPARGQSLSLDAMAYMTSNQVRVPFVVTTYAPSTLIVGHDTDVRALFMLIDRPVWVAMNARRVTVPELAGPGRIEVATDGYPHGAGACNPQPLLTPTATPIAPAPKPGVVLDTGSGVARGGVCLHISTGAVFPGRYEFELTIRYPANPLAPTVLNATGTLRVRLDLATPAPGQDAVCSPPALTQSTRGSASSGPRSPPS